MDKNQCASKCYFIFDASGSDLSIFEARWFFAKVNSCQEYFVFVLEAKLKATVNLAGGDFLFNFKKAVASLLEANQKLYLFTKSKM